MECLNCGKELEKEDTMAILIQAIEDPVGRLVLLPKGQECFCWECWKEIVEDYRSRKEG